MRIHPLAADGLIATALTTVAVLLGREAVAQGWPALDPLAWILVLVATLPLALRTKAPVTVFAFVHAVGVLYISLGYWPVVITFGPMLAVYTVASVRPARTTAVCAAVMGGVWVYAGLVTDGSSMASVLAQAVAYPLVYLNRTMTKLGLASRAQVVVVAYETGLVMPGGTA
ncbi:DUF7134 domain-containing protein [Streptomyces sp. NPDC002092]